MMRAIAVTVLLAIGAAEAAADHRAAPQDTPIFMPAHEALLKKARDGTIDVYFVGDSITRRWHGTDYPAHKANWEANFFGWNAANFGWGADTTHNVLWRMTHGELDGVEPKVIVLMIGTNNLSSLPPEGSEGAAAAEAAKVEEVVGGVRAILDVFDQKAPDARVVLVGVMPRNAGGRPTMKPTIDEINVRLAKFADGERIRFLNVNSKLADEEGLFLDGVCEDGVHLSTKGYQIWADQLKPIFTEWLGPPAKVDNAPPATGVPQVAE
jgi:lysophospholipase L1-like esterase